ncbi:ATP-binding protein [Erythrobacter sp. F6033]|uniref:sensor histidine kinase n=1 Tax=Erythrobacter sp. F6033 TaxID=2926401 RepID=UPI001FF557BB|nr:ATP-binding protein [Erythrobacter sp. F6033]MCK0128515.1 ATP-binding protein [Erythrobacter sp. F6033]
MDTRHSFPWAGLFLALVTFVAMIALGLDPVISLAVLVVWSGSLLLISGRPPEPPKVIVKNSFNLESMRGLIENSSTPIMVTEKNSIAIANAAARRMLGQHMIGQDARMAFRQPEAISLLGNDRNGRAILRGLARRQDIWEINRQGLGGDIAVIELINQTAEADISRAHTDFVANASHELRTPLAAILGYVETLSESADSLDTPTSRKFLRTIEREGKRLQNLISDLMSLSRVEAEKHDLPSEILELAPLVERAASDAAGLNRINRLDFALNCEPSVQGDAQQLEQLVRNLVDNSLKYGAPSSPVKVMLDLARDNHARISVVDEGEGIAPEQIPHLTRRFYRTDPGRSRASGGTGLGLAIVKHIVERHRGRLDIQSDLGKGTRVVVRIPLAETQTIDAKSEETEGPETGIEKMS